MILITALLNDLTMIAMSRDRASASPAPEHWRLHLLFFRAFWMGCYMALSTIIFFIVIWHTDFFSRRFFVEDNFTSPNAHKLHSIIYLQCESVREECYSWGVGKGGRGFSNEMRS